MRDWRCEAVRCRREGEPVQACHGTPPVSQPTQTFSVFVAVEGPNAPLLAKPFRAEALDKAELVRVDQDISDGWVLQ